MFALHAANSKGFVMTMHIIYNGKYWALSCTKLIAFSVSGDKHDLLAFRMSPVVENIDSTGTEDG